jgi:hypothetical protein
MERIDMDILCELPESGGNKHILVISDYYTKWTECSAMPNMEAKTVAKLLDPVSTICIGALFFLFGGFFCEQNEQPATYNFTSFCKPGQ